MQETPHDRWTDFVMSVFAVNGLILQVGEDIVAPLGQSSARWQVLGRAFHSPTVANIAREVGHARQSTQRVANALVTDGLLAYRPRPDDRRTQVVELIDHGSEVLEQIYARQVDWSHAVVEQIGETRLAEATASLRIIADRLGALPHIEKKDLL